MQVRKRIELKQSREKRKKVGCKPFGLTVCRFSYPAVVSGFNIYENQWSCIYAYVSAII